MDEMKISQSASPMDRWVDDQDSATTAGSRSVRSAVVILAFVIHFVAWVGFCALTVAASSYYFGDGLATGFVLLALACVAGAAAIVIARDLAPVPRSIVIVVSIAVFGISGIVEVVDRIVPPTQDFMVVTFGEAFPLIGMFIFPFLIAGVLVTVVSKRAVVSPRGESGQMLGAGITLLACALIVIAGVVPLFGLLEDLVPSGFQPGWPMAVGSAVGTVAALFLLERAQANSSPRGPSRVICVFGYIVLVCGMLLCMLSIAQIVDSTAMGSGGAVLWARAAFGFVVAAVAVLIASRAQTRHTVRQ